MSKIIQINVQAGGDKTLYGSIYFTAHFVILIQACGVEKMCLWPK